MIAIRSRGVDYIYSNRDEAMRIYAKIWQQDPSQVATYFPKYFGYEGEWTHGEFEKLGLDKMSEGLQLVGEVDKPVDWKTIIDQQFLPRACKVIMMNVGCVPPSCHFVWPELRRHRRTSSLSRRWRR